MNHLRAEKAVQLFSIAGIWMAFALVWASAPWVVAWLRDHHRDCSSLAALWLAVAQSGLALAVPTILTFVIARLVITRSRHANWVAGVSLAAGLLYVIGTIIAASLATFSLCISP
jgi:hypothetical protein